MQEGSTDEYACLLRILIAWMWPRTTPILTYVMGCEARAGHASSGKHPLSKRTLIIPSEHTLSNEFSIIAHVNDVPLLVIEIALDVKRAYISSPCVAKLH